MLAGLLLLTDPVESTCGFAPVKVWLRTPEITATLEGNLISLLTTHELVVLDLFRALLVSMISAELETEVLNEMTVELITATHVVSLVTEEPTVVVLNDLTVTILRKC